MGLVQHDAHVAVVLLCGVHVDLVLMYASDGVLLTMRQARDGASRRTNSFESTKVLKIESEGALLC